MLCGPPALWPNKPLLKHTEFPNVVVPSLAVQVSVDEEFERLLRFARYLWKRFSSFFHLCRVVAWIVHFCHNSNAKSYDKKKTADIVTTSEVAESKKMLFWLFQRERLAGVLEAIHNNKALLRGHVLHKLLITTNNDGLLVVSIRVRDPSSPQEPKLLVLLSQKSDLTKLLVQTLHTTYSHAGVSALVVIIANTYYIPGLRNIVNQVSKSCSHCQLAYGKPLSCRIGLLPAFRTTPAPPFFYTGIDFAGPFYVKRGKTRDQKC